MESTNLFKDHQKIYKELINRLEQLFQQACNICNRGTHYKEELDSEAFVDLFENSRENKQIMRTLTQLKVYEPVESDEFHGGKRFQLVNQNRVISTIWAMLRDKLKELTSNYISNVFNLSGDVGTTTNMRDLFVIWDRILATYHDAIAIVLPLLEYLTENYPLITKEIPKAYTVLDYSNKLLVESIKNQLGPAFVTFLEASLDYPRFQKDHNTSPLKCESPLALMNKYNIPVGDNSAQTVKDFYFNYLSDYVRNEISIPLDIHYLKNLINFLRQNSLLTGAISPTLIENANDIFLQYTILEPDTAAQIIEILKTNLPLRYSSKLYPFGALVENFQWIDIAFESRAKTIQLEEIYRRVVQRNLQATYPDPGKLFNEMCKLMLLADKKTKFRLIALTEMTKCLGGTLNVMEFYIRLCESSIRRTNRLQTENFVDSYSNSAAVFYAPTLFHISSAILSLYSRSLFRRAIMQGASLIMSSLWDTKSLENNILTFFKSQYGTTTEFHNLEATQEIIYKASKMQSSFEQNASRKSKLMSPLVFEKKMVPAIYQESTNEDVTLPKELVEAWNEFTEYFRTADKKAKMKKLHLVYHLQHCEIATPYKLKNGRRLTFELTLYQTCLLSLFNDVEMLEYEEILTKLQMTEETLFTVLKSFTDVGLLVANGEKYILNKNYTPDKKRIKDGKLRIPLSKSSGFSDMKKQTKALLANSQHHEGHSSQWKQELLKACIVRSLKGERYGLNLAALFRKVEEQIQGISMGEFKDALKKVLKDKFITCNNDLYVY